MKRLFSAFCLMSCICFSVLAQESATFEVMFSSDTLLLGNQIKVQFVLKNATGSNFTGPQFDGFRVISGPNSSQSYSSFNGQVSQSISYTYYLEPIDVGNYYVDPASIEVEGDYLETEPVMIIVMPNPDGVRQSPDGNNPFDWFRNEGLEFDFPGLEQFKQFDFPNMEQFEMPNLENFQMFDLNQLFDRNGMEDLFKYFQMEMDSLPRQFPQFEEAPKKKKRKTTKI